ncbi:hypothetical protein [Streptomyces brevispora]|uniref:hypothetical protein n=1 Tax=Streptomyces brevispora TaxID=887462 RepID=UPI0037F38F0C
MPLIASPCAPAPSPLRSVLVKPLRSLGHADWSTVRGRRNRADLTGGRHPDALASHFAHADDPRAAEYPRRAAARAAALFANDSADRCYRDLVARLDVDAARARLAHSQVLCRMGNFGEGADVRVEGTEGEGRASR